MDSVVFSKFTKLIKQYIAREGDYRFIDNTNTKVGVNSTYVCCLIDSTAFATAFPEEQYVYWVYDVSDKLKEEFGMTLKMYSDGSLALKIVDKYEFEELEHDNDQLVALAEQVVAALEVIDALAIDADTDDDVEGADPYY